MSLLHATLPDGSRPFASVPVPCADLGVLEGVSFQLPCEDPWLRERHGNARAYLDAAEDAWVELPEWMDFLQLDSPAYDIKRASRDLYLRHAPDAETVLDVGCGIGRFTQVMLDKGCTVTGVDGDLQSLQRCAWHAARRAGALDLHWSTAGSLPEVQVDLAIAIEVLCYVDQPRVALGEITRRIRSGGHLLFAMEARYGWAMAEDAPADGLAAILEGTSKLELDDRFVHLCDRDDMISMVEEAGLDLELIEPTHYVLEGPLEAMMPESLSLEELIAAEDRCREHPVLAPLNRIWTVRARKP